MTPVERLLAGRRIVICAGPGGVGKTTTAAALAMGLAERGLRVAVVTIDPARRLAAALGVPDLGNEPTRIDSTRFTPHGVQLRGELWALMLDPKRTFDALVERLAPDVRTRDEVLANRIYQQLSSAVAGAQEFSAVAKLYELDQAGRFDLLVLDTPPSRNALDFLDAPARVAAFFHGRAIRLFLRPAGLGSRIIGRGTGVLFGLMERVTGVDLLHDVSGFFRSVGGLIDGFLERARHVGELLQDPGTVFLVVTAPRHDPVEEAIFLHRRLRSAGMPVGGLVVNRVHEAPEARADLAPELGQALAGRVEASARELAALAARDAAAVARLSAVLGEPPAIVVPELDDEVHDVEGLAHVRAHLFAETA